MYESLSDLSGRQLAEELDSDLIRLGRVPSPIPRSGENPLFYYKPLVQASLAVLLGQRITLLGQDAFEYDVMYPCGIEAINKFSEEPDEST